MKRHLGLLLTLVFFGMSGMSLFGQSEVKAHVPFSFYVDNSLLPAGDYVISDITGNMEELLIRNQEKGTSLGFLTESTRAEKPLESSSLVFEVASGQHYLTEIWKEGREYGWKLILPKNEKRLVNAAQENVPHEIIPCTPMKKS